VNATGVTAGPAESNGKLLLGTRRDSLHVTCGLTACTPGSAPGPTLGNEYGKTLPFLLLSPLHPFNGPFSRTIWVSRYQKCKPVWIKMRHEMMRFSDGSGISWTICKQSAPRSRQITTPTPHHSNFYRPAALPLSSPAMSTPAKSSVNVQSCSFSQPCSS